MTPPCSTLETGRPTTGSGWATSPGHRRTRNEDAVLAGPNWFAVADGLGGHRAGDVAATIAVDVLAGHAVGSLDPTTCDAVIDAAIGDAHHRIRAAATGPRHGMGTTLVGVAPLTSGAAAVFHLGDCRCYRLVDGSLSLVTRDHTHVRELVDLGHLDGELTDRHPLRHVVTRHLGGDRPVSAEITVIEPPVGRLLLCSDGLSGQSTPRRIGRVLSAVRDPSLAARRLVDLVLDGPAPDNVTALVVDVMPGSTATGPLSTVGIGDTVGRGGGA